MSALQAIEFRPPSPEQATHYPFTIPAVMALRATRLVLATPVTLLVGENGSGKSTLMEALALAIGSITVGSREVERDQTLMHVRPLAERLKLIWQRKTKRGLFLRAEDFFGYAQRMQQMREEFEAKIRRLDADESLSRTARGLAKMPHQRELSAIKQRYGAGLDAVSHGESFLRLFQTRFVPDGVYLLDEPEAPLSPMRQLALLSLIKQGVEEMNCQFIIATHSPIVMAAPHATIYAVNEHGLQQVAFEDTEHVRLTRDFLNNPQQFLQHL